MVGHPEGFGCDRWQWQKKRVPSGLLVPGVGGGRDIESRNKPQCSLHALQQVEAVTVGLLQLLSNAKKHCFSGHEVQEWADKNAIPWRFHLSYSPTAAGLIEG